MNRFTFKTILVAFCLLLPCMAIALPGPHDPTTSGNGGTCENCHTPGATLGASTYNNICLTCHNGTSTAANSNVIQPFRQTDYADPFITTDSRSNPLQTSHKWTGTDVVPQAGALTPTDPYQTVPGKGLNKTSLVGSVTCARCHNIHGNSGPSSFVYPYLRSPNDNDQMCLDCHRSRNHSDQSFGSHPVNVDLAATATANPGSYNNPPLNANPGNPTAALNLIGGKVQCSTCHRVHYADSKSGTTHNAANFNTLSTSRGGLLRTDLYGNTAASLNVCTNCHVRPNHNVSGQNVQCNDCHSGHVDYISPADIALNPSEAIPNKFMLRRYVNYSSDASGKNTVKLSSYRKKMIYRNTSSWRNAQGTGVCQACHKLPTTIAEHSDLSVDNAGKCSLCHTGGTHSTVAPAGCSGCHGSPPQHTVAGTGGTGGYAVGTLTTNNYASSTVFKNESTAGHPTHAANKPGLYNYSCDQCHNGNRDAGTGVGTNHDAGSNASAAFQYVFQKPGVIAYTGTTPTYNGAGVGTCATLYCHSNGVVRAGGTPKYKSVPWATSRRSLVGTANECIACHNGVITGFNNLSTNSHFKHVSNLVASGKGYTCNYCHSGTAGSNNAIANASKHSDGVADVTLTGTFGALTVNGTWSTGPATCGTSYCHSNGKGVYATPTWTTRSSGQCDSCHKTANNVSGILSSGAHFTHISSSFGPKLNSNNFCNSCHVYTIELGTSHVDGTLSMNAAGANLCQNCHAGTVPAGTTNWAGFASLSCQSCHSGRGNGSTDIPANTSWSSFNGTGVRAPFKGYTTFTNRGHGKGATYNTCQSCHDATSRHITGVLGDSNRLLSGLGSGSTGAECAFCHNDASKVTISAFRGMSSHLGIGSSYVGGGGNNYSTRSLCDVCHDPHGSKNAAMIRTFVSFGTAAGFGNLTATISFNTKTGRADYVQTAPPYRGLCQVCHTKTSTFKRNSAVVAHNGTSDCLSCHSHIGKSFAFQPSGTCSSCHGYPPAKVGFVGSTANYANFKTEDYTGGGGAHTLPGHVPATAVESQGWTNCNTCHPNVSGHNNGGAPPKIQFVNVTTQDAYRFNTSKAPSYTGNHTTTVGSCNNVSCHFKQTPVWNRP